MRGNGMPARPNTENGHGKPLATGVQAVFRPDQARNTNKMPDEPPDGVKNVLKTDGGVTILMSDRVKSDHGMAGCCNAIPAACQRPAES